MGVRGLMVVLALVASVLASTPGAVAQDGEVRRDAPSDSVPGLFDPLVEPMPEPAPQQVPQATGDDPTLIAAVQVESPASAVYFHTATDRFLIGSGDSVLAFDRNGTEVARGGAAQGPVTNVVNTGQEMWTFDEGSITQRDPLTLAPIVTYATDGLDPPSSVAVTPTQIVSSTYTEWSWIDRSSGLETRGPVGTTGHPFVAHHPTWGEIVVSSGGSTNGVQLFDVSTHGVRTEVAAVADRSFVGVGGDGTLFTTDGIVLERRSSVDLTLLDQHDVPLDFGFPFKYAPSVAAVVTDDHLYDLGTDTSIARAHRVNAVSADGRVTAAVSGSTLEFRSTAPVLTSADQALWRPDLYDRLTLTGENLGSVTSVTVSGNDVPFTLVDGAIVADVSAVPSNAGAAGTVVVDGTLGPSTLVLPGEVQRGEAIITVTAAGLEVDQKATFEVDCELLDDNDDGDLPSFELGAGDARLLVVPSLRECLVKGLLTDRALRSGFWTPGSPGSWVDVDDSRIQFRTGRPAHLLYAFNDTELDRVVWIFPDAFGGAPAGADYPVRVTCGSYSADLVVRTGFGARHILPEFQFPRDCTVVLLDDLGAASVRAAFRDRSSADYQVSHSASFNTVDLYGDGWVSFAIDHGGHDIWAPLVVGVPGEAIGTRSEAGAVQVFPTGFGGVPGGSGAQILYQGSGGLGGGAERGDRFGETLAQGDFNGDGWWDLAIGVPGEDFGSKVDVGMVHIVYGNETGFRNTFSRTLHQASAGAPGSAEAGDRFGEALAVVDYNADGWDDIAVGVPGEDIGTSLVDAGIVQVFYGGLSGITTSGAETLSQASPTFAGGRESDDRFGQSLAGSLQHLGIGAPGEDLGGAQDAGMVYVVNGVTRRADSTRQGAGSTSGAPEDGDEFGTTLAMNDGVLFVGVPNEDLGSRVDAGMVHGLAFDQRASTPSFGSGGSTITESRLWGSGSSQADDRFGSSLGVLLGSESDFLLIGAPGESVNGRPGAGTAHLVRMVRFTPWNVWDQDSDGVSGVPEAGDGFGATVGPGARGSLVVGVPGEGIGSRDNAGMVYVTSNGVDWRSVHQNTKNVPGTSETGDRLGGALPG